MASQCSVHDAQFRGQERNINRYAAGCLRSIHRASARFTKKGLSKYYKHFQGVVNRETGVRVQARVVRLCLLALIALFAPPSPVASHPPHLPHTFFPRCAASSACTCATTSAGSFCCAFGCVAAVWLAGFCAPCPCSSCGSTPSATCLRR